MDPDLLTMDDMPADAQQLIDEMETEISMLRDQVRRQSDEIRARADRAVADLEIHCEDQVRNRQMELLQQLKPMQDECIRQGKLDEALAIRDRIRTLKADLLRAEEDPGNLSDHVDDIPGTQVLYLVTGSTGGSIWGTDIYTTDSTLATAAVHAGVLREGERGVVRVTIVDTLNVTFTGIERHGVLSYTYGQWPAGYRVARA